MSAGTKVAEEGTVWVCAACGKTSRTQFGFNANNEHVADLGWDESCMMNAVLCKSPKVGELWEAV